MKIDAAAPATAHHVVLGATVFPYAVDAHSAVSRHPNEWSHAPWTAERAAKARAAIRAKHDADVAAGVMHPTPLLPDAEPLDPETQAAVDTHTRAQQEAAKRLEAHAHDEAERKKLEEQVAADRLLVATPAPKPDPNIRRPFGRKGEPSEAERAMMEKRARKDAE